jgi:PAS domain S-box-containing protein
MIFLFAKIFRNDKGFGMRIYPKILLTILPLVLVSLFAIVGTVYYFSRTALVDLGETWLDTRLHEAMVIVSSQQEMLEKYGLANIPASMVKAKMDAAELIADIGVGKMGYMFGITREGTVVFHPDSRMVDTDVSHADWFREVLNQSPRLVMDLNREPALARVAYFAPWEWYVLAVDPMEEIYGVADRMRPHLYAMGAAAAFIISLALMLVIRRLTRPLKDLVQGADKIGKGDLATRIPIQSQDEFGRLSNEFNQMAFRLQETLTALKHSEEHFRALIENASDMVWIVDEKGGLKYASPSTRRILGYDPESLMGIHIFDDLHPEDREAARDRFKRRVQGIWPAPNPIAEQRYLHKDGTYRTLESITKNMLDHPAVQGVIINSRDITQRKMAEQALKQSHQELEKRVAERTRHLTLLNQALNNEILVRKQKEKELKKANQAKSEFLANMSHEIRTPLNAIIGFSEVLSAMVMDARQKNYLQTVSTSARQLLALINNILEMSRIGAGKVDIKRTEVSLDTLFHEIHHLFKVKLAKKQLRFHVLLDDTLPDYLFLDDLRIRQVLTNLVDNAVKFTREGHISLSARVHPGSAPKTVDLTIQVSDTGIGIPEDKQQLVFESFEQGAADINRKYGGTGLGLAICRQLVELMQGRIRLEVHPGRGTTFDIFLPGVTISPHKKEKPDLPDAAAPDPFSDTSAEVLSETVFRRALERHPELGAQVQAQIIPLLPGSEDGVKISDAQTIADRLMEMGRQFDLEPFKRFGQDLSDFSAAFDVENIALSLARLSAMAGHPDDSQKKSSQRGVTGPGSPRVHQCPPA